MEKVVSTCQRCGKTSYIQQRSKAYPFDLYRICCGCAHVTNVEEEANNA